jgi:hypothetical protein
MSLVRRAIGDGSSDARDDGPLWTSATGSDVLFASRMKRTAKSDEHDGYSPRCDPLGRGSTSLSWLPCRPTTAGSAKEVKNGFGALPFCGHDRAPRARDGAARLGGRKAAHVPRNDGGVADVLPSDACLGGRSVTAA